MNIARPAILAVSKKSYKLYCQFFKTAAATVFGIKLKLSEQKPISPFLEEETPKLPFFPEIFPRIFLQAPAPFLYILSVG